MAICTFVGHKMCLDRDFPARLTDAVRQVGSLQPDIRFLLGGWVGRSEMYTSALQGRPFDQIGRLSLALRAADYVICYIYEDLEYSLYRALRLAEARRQRILNLASGETQRQIHADVAALPEPQRTLHADVRSGKTFQALGQERQISGQAVRDRLLCVERRLRVAAIGWAFPDQIQCGSGGRQAYAGL